MSKRNSFTSMNEQEERYWQKPSYYSKMSAEEIARNEAVARDYAIDGIKKSEERAKIRREKAKAQD